VAEHHLKPSILEVAGKVHIYCGRGTNLHADRCYIRQHQEDLISKAGNFEAAIATVTLFVPASVVSNGCELVDTPGANDDDAYHETELREAVMEAHMVVAGSKRDMSADKSMCNLLSTSGFLEKLITDPDKYRLTYLHYQEKLAVLPAGFRDSIWLNLENVWKHGHLLKDMWEGMASRTRLTLQKRIYKRVFAQAKSVEEAEEERAIAKAEADTKTIMSRSVYVSHALPALSASLQLNSYKAAEKLATLKKNEVMEGGAEVPPGKPRDLTEVQRLCGGMELLARIKRFVVERRSAVLKEIAALLREWLAHRPSERREGMQEVVTAATSLHRAAHIKDGIKELKKLENSPPIPLRTLRKKLMDAVEEELCLFFESDSFQGQLKAWRDAGLKGWKKFDRKFKLKTTSQINPSKLQHLKRFPLFPYLFISEFNKDYHEPLPVWNWSGIRDAIQKAIQRYMDDRGGELQILLRKLLLARRPKRIAEDAYNDQIEKALETYLPAAFGRLSASITQQMVNSVAATDKLCSDASKTQRDALVACLESCREEFDDDVGAIQSNLPYFLFEDDDNVFTSWIQRFLEYIMSNCCWAITVKPPSYTNLTS
jgi:hypothetical protein